MKSNRIIRQAPHEAEERDGEAGDLRNRKAARLQATLTPNAPAIASKTQTTPKLLKQPQSPLRLVLIAPSRRGPGNLTVDHAPVRSASICVATGTLSGFWPIVLGLVVFALLLSCLRPTRNLRSDPPPEFTAVKLQQGVDQREWTQAYWDCARSLRRKYTYGVPLPHDPPAEFRIPQEGSISRGAAEETRQAYWKRLQKIWVSSAAWETDYDVRSEWVSAATRTLRELESDIVKAGRASLP